MSRLWRSCTALLRILRLALTPILLAALLAAVVPASAAAEEVEVTIGFLPSATRNAEVMIRGSAPAGSIVALSVNGELRTRVYAATTMAVYNGKVSLDPGLNVITAQVEGTEAVATASLYRITVAFSDLEGDPLRDDIELLATLGVLSGDGTGRFLPEDPLNRAQLAKLLAEALGLPEADPALVDGLADAAALPGWARPYVAAAFQAGLLRGYPDGTFQPDRALTRAELVATVVRAVPEDLAGDRPAISWADEVPVWAQPAADRAARLGLIESFWGEAFRGDDPVTRKEAAGVIRRLMEAAPRGPKPMQR